MEGYGLFKDFRAIVTRAVASLRAKIIVEEERRYTLHVYRDPLSLSLACRVFTLRPRGTCMYATATAIGVYERAPVLRSPSPLPSRRDVLEHFG